MSRVIGTVSLVMCVVLSLRVWRQWKADSLFVEMYRAQQRQYDEQFRSLYHYKFGRDPEGDGWRMGQR